MRARVCVCVHIFLSFFLSFFLHDLFLPKLDSFLLVLHIIITNDQQFQYSVAVISL